MQQCTHECEHRAGANNLRGGNGRGIGRFETRQCTRAALAGSTKCWQHQDEAVEERAAEQQRRTVASEALRAIERRQDREAARRRSAAKQRAREACLNPSKRATTWIPPMEVSDAQDWKEAAERPGPSG